MKTHEEDPLHVIVTMTFKESKFFSWVIFPFRNQTWNTLNFPILKYEFEYSDLLKWSKPIYKRWKNIKVWLKIFLLFNDIFNIAWISYDE